MKETPGHVNGVVVGPFEEEEEGTGITSDVVKVKGAESGHPRSPDLRNDTGTAISPISGQQKQLLPSGFFDSFVLVLTLFIFKAPNYMLARTLTERVV